MKKIGLIILILLLIAQVCPIGALTPRQDSIANSGHIKVDGSLLRYAIEGEGIPCLVIGSSIYYPRTFSQDLKKHLKMYFCGYEMVCKALCFRKFESCNYCIYRRRC